MTEETTRCKTANDGLQSEWNAAREAHLAKQKSEGRGSFLINGQFNDGSQSSASKKRKSNAKDEVRTTMIEVTQQGEAQAEPLDANMMPVPQDEDEDEDADPPSEEPNWLVPF